MRLMVETRTGRHSAANTQREGVDEVVTIFTSAVAPVGVPQGTCTTIFLDEIEKIGTTAPAIKTVTSPNVCGNG
jgi:hypothetical protein